MCEDEKRGHHHGHHGHHHKKFSTLVKRTEKEILIPEILFDVANIKEGDYFMVSIRKIKKNE